MQIKVKYFASLREQLGRSEDLVTIPEQTTIAELWSQLTQGQTLTQDVKSAVNQEYVKPDTILKENDEVDFFPPVTGG